jgi:carboxymethylenebutenolidase
MNVAISTTAEEFAAEGFKTLVPDLYRGKCAKSAEDAGINRSNTLNGIKN